MADAAVLKKARAAKKLTVTKRTDSLKALLDQGSPFEAIEEGYNDLRKSYEAMEEAHEQYFIEATDQEIKDEGDFLLLPGKSFAEVRVRFFKAKKDAEGKAAGDAIKAESDRSEKIKKDEAAKEKAERKVEFDKLAASFKASAPRFLAPCVRLEHMRKEGINFKDFRDELEKIMGEFDRLKSQLDSLPHLDPTAELKDIVEIFEKDVLAVYDPHVKAGLEYLKADTTPSTSRTSRASSGGASGGSSFAGGSVKRESVSLPKFSGKEPNAFLDYPVWRTNWDKLITVYPEEVRATVLIDHLDELAKRRLVGLENDYALSLEKLKSYFGNNLKVVQCCLREIAGVKPIKGANDYTGLVAYSRIIDTNYKRLKAIEEEKEISNTTVTNEIVQRLPAAVQDKYMDFFMDLADTEKKDPLPQLIAWMDTQRKRWEFQETARISTKDGRGVLAHYGNASDGGGDERRAFNGVCYKCDKEGHMRKDCPGDKGGGGKKIEGKPRYKVTWCAFHNDPPLNHHTISCTRLRKLPADERLKLLEKNKDCPICVGDHAKSDCRSTRVCGGEKGKSGCGTAHNLHELFCPDAKILAHVGVILPASITPGEEMGQREITLATRGKRNVVLQVMRVPGVNKRDEASVIWDGCSTGRFVRNAYAEASKFKYRSEMLTVTGIAGETHTRQSKVYTCYFHDLDGIRYTFEAYGLDTVTCTMGKLDMSTIKTLFPNITQKELRLLQRRDEVDYLIGYENPSWHPERQVKATNGGDFWLHRSRFGCCVGGSHPDIQEDISLSADLFTVVKTFFVDSKSRFSQVQPPKLQFGLPHCEKTTGEEESSTVTTCMSKTAPLTADKFFMLESLGTPVDLKCGGCVCSKCPIPGSRFSFQEQWQLDFIRRLLKFDTDKKRWVAGFPWIKPRDILPNNYVQASKALVSTERKLRKIEGGGALCAKQINDMRDRKAVVKLSPAEAESYRGVVHYIPHLLVYNPGSKSSPVRIVFDASRPQGKNGLCLNECLAKGPDNYVNNLCGVLVTFRTGREAGKGDIRKFFNSVYLLEEDAQCQRFLWRDLEEERDPDIYMVVTNNLGIRPSGTIATSALEMTADKFMEIYPSEAVALKEDSYVDDIQIQANDLAELQTKARRTDEILEGGGFENKGWIFSHQPGEPVEFGNEMEDSESYGFNEKVLGMRWEPLRDVFRFIFRLNLGPRQGKVKLEPDIPKMSFIRNPPMLLTRRLVLSIIAALFDPLSLLTPILLQAKILLRRSWSHENEKIGWDDPLPSDQVAEWIQFLTALYDLGDVEFDRSITPPGNTVGQPWLLIFSDGALVSFGACAYIRWELEDGSFWCRLIMGKGKIAPKCRSTIPRMELSGATLQVRMESFVKERTSFNFSKTMHMVDSSTVLGYLNKDNGSFKPYEGVRIAEIQSNSNYVNGVLQDWAWISGASNPADLTTKPVKPSEVGRDSIWQRGPDFVYEKFEDWPIKTTFSKEVLEGELVHAVLTFSKSIDGEGHHWQGLNGTLARCSTLYKLLRTTVRVLRIAVRELKPVKEGQTPGKFRTLELCGEIPTAGEMSAARKFWTRRAQEELLADLDKSVMPTESAKNPSRMIINGKFKKLAPVRDSQGIWRVGSRMQSYVPFTGDNKAPALVPYHHRFTLLLMWAAHRQGHGGQDATLSNFRLNGYWCPQGGKLAKKVKNACIGCRMVDMLLLRQPMGPIPSEKLMSPMAWGNSELDLMGPFICRGEKNPRTSIKTWGLVVVDQNSGAVHADIVADYSASAVLAALRRFGSVRGWPASISSDPGSQLVSAGGKIEKWWEVFQDSLKDFGGRKGFKWDISPANSPWRQGRAERRIGQLKRQLKLALGDTRVTSTELQTCLMEAASLVNDMPVSIGAPKEDGSYPVITPHTLLMGRSKNTLPDDAELAEGLPYRDRYRIINQVTDSFWSKWSTQVTPKYVTRQKWHGASTRQLKLGDLVRVADKTAIKAKYRLAIVTALNTSSDGNVRSVELTYHAPGSGKKSRGKAIVITRSVQRLALIMGAEEQEGPLVVIEDHTHVAVMAADKSD